MQCRGGFLPGDDAQYRAAFLLRSVKMSLCYWLQGGQWRSDFGPALLGKETRLPCSIHALPPCSVCDVEGIQKV